MRRACGWKVWVVGAVLILAVGAAQAEGEINVLAGKKSLDNAWDPLDGQIQYGIVINIGNQWPVALAVDVLTSSDDVTGLFPDGMGGMIDLTLEAETQEIDLGVRKLFLDGNVQPYVGGGLGLISGELSATAGGIPLVLDDSAVGIWVDAGVMFRATKHFNVGLDVRWSTADVDFDIGGGLGSEEVDAGGVGYAVMLGYRWGR